MVPARSRRLVADHFRDTFADDLLGRGPDARIVPVDELIAGFRIAVCDSDRRVVGDQRNWRSLSRSRRSAACRLAAVSRSSAISVLTSATGVPLSGSGPPFQSDCSASRLADRARDNRPPIGPRQPPAQNAVNAIQPRVHHNAEMEPRAGPWAPIRRSPSRSIATARRPPATAAPRHR